MKERPILFSAPMVRAILEGRKTQTRRIMKPQPERENAAYLCKYGEPGDRIWVKETHARLHEDLLQHLDPDPRSPHWQTVYRADGDPAYWNHYGMHWKPSIFMRREYSRITLEITNVRTERLQDISEADAKAEGVNPGDTRIGCGEINGKIVPWFPGAYPQVDHPIPPLTCRSAYACLWESINGQCSWEANPWVWAITLKRITP